MPALSFDAQFRKDGYRLIAGTDEAGRGPLAGPVVAAACILPPDFLPQDLDDSKKLSEKKREGLAEIIKEHAVSWSVAYSEVEEIEALNILNASLLAMNRAIEGLSVKPDFAIIDGNQTKSIRIPCRAVVGGDGLCPSVAAASILAKTARDAYCREELDKKYPQYGFAVHKGYGTRAHYEAVDKYGLCPEHRASFFKKYFEKRAKEASE